MTDYWPSMRVILTAFFCLHWYYRGFKPFSWWVLFIFIIFDFILATAMVSLYEKATKASKR